MRHILRLILSFLIFKEICSYEKAHNEDVFTVRVNTFQRPDLLRLFLAHYSTCSSVSHISIVWSDTKATPPPLPSHSYRMNVSYEVHGLNSLNNRFRNLSAIHTEAVLSIDDDGIPFYFIVYYEACYLFMAVIVSCSSLAFAFQVWSANPHALVGFSPRLHAFDPYTGLHKYLRWQHTWWNGMYSIVLTKAAFLHRDYLIAFQRTIPSDVLAMIDSGRNGEDIAMAHVVANITKAAPVWVKVEAYETADSGISSGGKKHFSDRGKSFAYS